MTNQPRLPLLVALWLCAVAVLLTGDSVNAANGGPARIPPNIAAINAGNRNWRAIPTTGAIQTLTPKQAQTVRVIDLPKSQGTFKQGVEASIKKFGKNVAKELAKSALEELVSQFTQSDTTSAGSVTLATYTGFPLCSEVSLYILNEQRFADIKMCKSYAAYDLRNIMMPTDLQKASLCSGPCLPVRDRLLMTPIPYCAMTLLNGGTADLLGFLFEKFSKCTVIPQRVQAVHALAEAGSGSGSRNESDAGSEPEDAVPEPEDVATTPASTTETPTTKSAARAEHHAVALATASFIVALVLA